MARRPDVLGLRQGAADRGLALLVAAMAFLAALALAGATGAAGLARHWQAGAAAAVTVQVPDPTLASADATVPRLDRVLALLRETPGVASARALDAGELADLLRPWLGAAAGRIAVPLPGVVSVHLAGAGPDLAALAARLEAAAPATQTESHGVWVARLALLARSLQACAWIAVALVGLIAVVVTTVATRAGLMARREAIEVIHGLGADDSYIARRFAGRVLRRALSGGILGTVAALPVLLTLASLTTPFTRAAALMPPLEFSWPAAQAWSAMLPDALWATVPALPLAAAVFGYVTAFATVRTWLRQLP